jgi:hypothetical protein
MNETTTLAIIAAALILLWLIFEPMLQCEERRAKSHADNAGRYGSVGCVGLLCVLAVVAAGLAVLRG